MAWLFDYTKSNKVAYCCKLSIGLQQAVGFRKLGDIKIPTSNTQNKPQLVSLINLRVW